MISGDTHFLLLYLVCVFQPVTRRDLFKEAVKAAETSPGESNTRIAPEALKELIKRKLVLEDNGLISCTALGNQRAAKLGLRHVEVPVRTIYGAARTTHFHGLKDTLRVMRLVLGSPLWGRDLRRKR